MSFLLGTLFHSVQETAIKLLGQFRVVLYKFALFFFTSTAILWLAVFMYACFYYAYIPSVSHVKPVHFGFQTCGDGFGICSYPTANVTLMRKGYEQFLVRGQRYKVYLDLEMPESPVNRELGMFMIQIDFKNRIGEIIQSSSRATMLHFKSTLLHTINTIFFTPLLLTGTFEEKQTINIELFDYYEEDAMRPSIAATLIIQNHKIQFYSATLRIFAHFSGIRYLMFHWPISAAIIGIGTNLFFLTIIALLSWYRYIAKSGDTQVIVKIDLDKKNIEQRRIQAIETLNRERQRQTSVRESGRKSRSVSPMVIQRRTQSLEQLSSKNRMEKIDTEKSQLEESGKNVEDEVKKDL